MIDKETGMSAKERMGEEIATLAARIDAATYELLVLIRRFDEEEGWNCGFLNCARWLTWRIGLAPSAAREKVRVARALGDLPLISEAMKRGQLSYSKVRALTRVARPETEKELVELGRAGTAAHIERVVRAWRRIDRSVEAADDEPRDASSHVTTHIDENGMFVIRGRLAPEAGEVLMKALKGASEKLYAEQQEDRPPVGKGARRRVDAGCRERAQGRARPGFERRPLPGRGSCERGGTEGSGRGFRARLRVVCFRGSLRTTRFRGSAYQAPRMRTRSGSP